MTFRQNVIFLKVSRVIQVIDSVVFTVLIQRIQENVAAFLEYCTRSLSGIANFSLVKKYLYK